MFAITAADLFKNVDGYGYRRRQGGVPFSMTTVACCGFRLLPLISVGRRVGVLLPATFLMQSKRNA